MAQPHTNELSILLQEIEKLNKKVDSLYQQSQAKPQVSLKELGAALASAQAEFKIARPSKENNYFKMKYETLEDVVRASRPALTKNGLSVNFQTDVTIDGANLITCFLRHSSGEVVSSTMRILPVRNDPRSVASEVEYIKRLLYAGITGVAADDDDDAEMAMTTFREEDEKGTSLTMKYNPKENPRITITTEQLQELNYELEKYPDLAEKVKHQLNLKYLADMPKDKFRDAMNRIREIKALREGTIQRS